MLPWPTNHSALSAIHYHTATAVHILHRCKRCQKGFLPSMCQDLMRHSQDIGGSETEVSNRSAFVGTPSPEGFPAPHGSADRQAAEHSQRWDRVCSQSSLSQQLSPFVQHCQYLPTCTINILQPR